MTVTQLNTSSLKLKKYTYISLGWLSFCIGFIGMFLPLLPTVIFWIIAVWFWSKGSPKLMERVYQNPKHGASIKAFMHHGVVPRVGKIAAVISMSLSYLLFQLVVSPNFLAGMGTAAMLFVVALWLITRPETPVIDD